MPALAFAITPPLSVQVAGCLRQAATDNPRVEGSGGWALDLEIRLNDAATSFGVTVFPFENLIPLRILNTHRLPPFVGVGTFCAMSGTTVNASFPPAFLKASRLSYDAW